MPATNREPGFIEFMPVSIFGAIMGMTGLSFAWELAGKAWGVSLYIKDTIGALAVLSFVALTAAYLVKMKKYTALVKKEFQHPVSVSFFATFIISLLLIPGLLLPFSVKAATIMWSIGAILMLAFAAFVLRKWLAQPQDPANAMPAWLLPIVGTLDAPLVGSRLPIPGIHEICLLFFAIGVIFSIILLTIIMSRVIFQAPLPEAVQPTLLIMVAPFALAFSGYQLITGLHDLTASIFFYGDLFLLLIFGSKVFLLAVCCPFRVTWWAVSFPLTAFTIAAFRYAADIHSTFFQFIPAIMLVISTVVILYLFCQTIFKIATNRFISQTPIAEKSTPSLEFITK